MKKGIEMGVEKLRETRSGDDKGETVFSRFHHLRLRRVRNEKC
jgi:hypothetical protein